MDARRASVAALGSPAWQRVVARVPQFPQFLRNLLAPGFRRICPGGFSASGNVVDFLRVWLAWFLFFPNAPYIVTDFVHLEHRPPVPLWFDLMMIASFAWTGLCLGYLSLYLMQEVARARFGRWISWVFVVVMLALGSVGVYAGRVLRWNSWDVVRHPRWLLHQSLDLTEGTVRATRAIAAFISVLFLFLLTTYCATFALTHLHDEAS